jgi:hypothetical protein
MVYLTEVGLISLATMGFAFLTAALGVAYKSKCSHVRCCGCMEIERNIEIELKEDLAEVARRRSIENPRNMNMLNQI